MNLTNHPLNETDTLYEVPPGGVAILITLYVIVALTAIIGNTMIVTVVMRSKKLRGVTNYFIANLAAADIMIGALAVPFTFQSALLQKWVLPEFMCGFCPFIQTLSLNVSIFTLVAISLDRFRAVIFPLRARTSHLKTKLCIIPIWIFSFVLAIPTFIALKTRTHVNGYELVCDMIGMEISLWKLYNNTLVILQYFIPLFVIVVAYTAMGIKLYNDKSNVVSARSDSSTIQENRKKVVKMMIIVIFLFGTCWFPYQMYNILSEIYPSINDYRYINLIFFAFHLLAMSNSCFNPFIYFFYSEVYNVEMRTYFSWCFKSRQEIGHSHSRSTATENDTLMNTYHHGVSSNNSPNLVRPNAGSASLGKSSASASSPLMKSSTLSTNGSRISKNDGRQITESIV